MPIVPSGTAAWRSSLSTGSSTTAAESIRSASAIRLAAGASTPRGSGVPSSSRASSAARSASRRRSSASCARARAWPERVETTAAATRNTTSATQFSPSAIVNWPVGGMWKKLNAAAAAKPVASPSSRP